MVSAFARGGALASEFIPEPDIIYFGAVPAGESVQIQRGGNVVFGADVLDRSEAAEAGYVVRVKLVSPLETPTPLPPDGKAYIGSRATVFVQGVAQGQVLLDERGAIYRLNFPSPARTPSPNAVLTPEKLVPQVPTPPSCGAVTCTATVTPSVTSTPTQTRTPTHTATATHTSTAAIISGSVTLEGRPAKPDPRWSVPLRVSLTRTSEQNPALQLTPATDNNGTFRVEGVPPDSYVILVKNPKTLQVKTTRTLSSGVNTIDFGTLKAGDANDDNVVSLIDFSILRTTFGLTLGQPGFDGRADFNDNQTVNLLDFSLMRPNFSQLGSTRSARRDQHEGTKDTKEDAEQEFVAEENAATPTATARATQTALVQVAVMAPRGPISRDQVFDVQIEVGSSFQPIDGAAAYLDYDPQLLQVVGLTAGTTLPQVLQSQFATPGQVSFAAGTFANFPTGRFVLATVQFRALSDIVDSRLTLSTSASRQTDVSFAGNSVLVCVNNAAIGSAADPSIAQSPVVVVGSGQTGAQEATPTPSATATPESVEIAVENEPKTSGNGCQVASTSGASWLLLLIPFLRRRRWR
ncbi:MAG TPA: cohesin domain-containing protein [Terriglobales bacterium]|nr:cohesin domain-containing protein [Terriglobales bacterium]